MKISATTLSALKLLKSISPKDLKNIRRILAHIKQVSYESLMLYPEKILLNQDEQQIFTEFLERYERSEPISKIIGIKDFWKDSFIVNSSVLDPRPETEILVEAVLRCFNEGPRKILDIGTGSGCILLSLLREFPKAPGIGIDISSEAIEVAKRNRDLLKIDPSRGQFLNISWNDLRNLINQMNNLKTPQYYGEESLLDGIDLDGIDLIVSNPPYIRTADIDKLDENVRNYDPRIALDGGKDGLDSYREICAIAKEIFAENQKNKENKNDLLKPIGRIFLEVGYDQANDVAEILKDNGFDRIKKTQDLSGIERIVEGVLN